MHERLAMIQQMEAQKQADTRLDNAIAYARRLEEIIERVPMDVNTRLLVNSLVGSAKEKFDMYNN